jgi:hypothetical protein
MQTADSVRNNDACGQLLQSFLTLLFRKQKRARIDVACFIPPGSISFGRICMVLLGQGEKWEAASIPYYLTPDWESKPPTLLHNSEG